MYNLLLERLGGWADKDLKTTSGTEFEDVFPTPGNKALLLGELAFHVLNRGKLSRIEASAIIKHNLHAWKQTGKTIIPSIVSTIIKKSEQ